MDRHKMLGLWKSLYYGSWVIAMDNLSLGLLALAWFSCLVFCVKWAVVDADKSAEFTWRGYAMYAAVFLLAQVIA